MTIDSLKIIGEELNYSIRRIGALMDSAYKTNNLEGIKRIAQEQESKGAAYLDINIGSLPVEMMALTTKAVQEVVSIPLCFDSDDVSKLEAGLEAYDCRKGLPILNSATEFRIDKVLSLRNKKDCQVVLLVYDRMDGDSHVVNKTREETYQTSKRLFAKALEYKFKPDQIYIDPGMHSIGADEHGFANLTLDTIEKVNSDPDMRGVHTLVGLSNLTFDMPPKSKLPLQNAFLTLAIERGLDTIIGNLGRKYEILEKEDPYLVALHKVLESETKLRTLIDEIYPLVR